jgi:hypothetical protein
MHFVLVYFLWQTLDFKAAAFSLPCAACRQRFYDGDELYKHMEGRHEHCFICRRRDPNKFVYYKDYAELEGRQVYQQALLMI